LADLKHYTTRTIITPVANMPLVLYGLYIHFKVPRRHDLF